MKNKNAFVIFFSVIFILSIIIISSSVNKTNRNNTDLTETTVNEISYYLKDYNGKIAVFKGNSEVPYHIYDVFTDSLPKEDSEAIKYGIEAHSENELKNLVADYLS